MVTPLYGLFSLHLYHIITLDNPFDMSKCLPLKAYFLVMEDEEIEFSPINIKNKNNKDEG